MYISGQQSTYTAACSAYMYIPLCGQHRYALPYKSHMYICTGAPGVSLHAYPEYRVKIVAGWKRKVWQHGTRLLKFTNLHPIQRVSI